MIKNEFTYYSTKHYNFIKNYHDNIDPASAGPIPTPLVPCEVQN